jgi:hypothetical protein
MPPGKAVIVAGDGTSLWTRRAVDFARRSPFGNKQALDDIRITNDRSSLGPIHAAIGRGFGVEAIHAHVPSDTVRNKVRRSPPMGAVRSAVLDNSKIMHRRAVHLRRDSDVIPKIRARTRGKARTPGEPSADAAAADALMVPTVAERCARRLEIARRKSWDAAPPQFEPARERPRLVFGIPGDRAAHRTVVRDFARRSFLPRPAVPCVAISLSNPK